MNNPVGIAVDADGNLAVVNGGGGVDIFAQGANGDVSPMRTFSAPGGGSTIALDPYNASILLGLVTDLSRVSTFSPTGMQIRTLASFVFQSQSPDNGFEEADAQFVGVNVDANDQLVVGFNYAGRYDGGGRILVFAPHAIGSDGPIGGIGSWVAEPGPDFFWGFTYSRNSNELVMGLDFPLGICEYAENPSAPLVRQFFAPSTFSDNVSAIGIDQSGNVFVSDTTVDAIWLLSPSGATGFATAGKLGGPSTGLANVTNMTVGSL